MSNIRFSGIASGMDTENIIKELMNVEKMRVTRVEKEKTKLQWKKDVWKEMNTKIYDFYKKQVFDLKSSGSFLKKSVTTSDDNAISVTASSGAPRGTHSIKIDNLAEGSFLTSNNKVASSYKATADGTFTISSGENASTFKITKEMTVAQIIEQINKADVDIKASYDSEFGKIFLSTTNTGKDSTIRIGGINTAEESTLMSEIGFTSTGDAGSIELTGGSSTVLKGGASITSDGRIILSNGTDSKVINIKKDEPINDIKDKINELAIEGVTADIVDGELKLNIDEGITLNIEGTKTLLTDMGFVDVVDGGEILGSAGADASFTYNGANLKSDSNEVSVNGLNITLKKAEGIDVSINVTQDTDAIYDKVKDFVLKYNELVLDINGKVNADSARKYEPLTSEEKEAMGEDEVKLWEKKIKDSLLRRDDVLTGLASAMRGVVVSSSGVDTADMDYNYLSDLGIVTGSYTEKGILHISGDEDDSLYSMKENKLKEAIENDPDKVAELLNAIGNKLYETMQDEMKSTTLSSALTFYNDKQMDKQVSEYESKIATLEERMYSVENRYYRQFTAMEKMIQQMNSQSSSLMGMMGGGM